MPRCKQVHSPPQTMGDAVERLRCMTNAIRNYFESRAPTWNSMMPNHLDEALHRMIAPFAEVFGATRALLEIGTGTGALIPHLVDCAPGVRLISIDLAHGMLLQARERCPNACLVEADAHRLPFASGEQSQFDVVVCHNSFPHFADRARALEEIRRVLRPGGQLFILHNNPRERVNAIHSQAGGPIARDLLPPGEDLRQMLVQAGYINVWVDDTSEHYLARAWYS
jgi:ubiquinone/menaquinone biosynthesis C-methylase UbiE